MKFFVNDLTGTSQCANAHPEQTKGVHINIEYETG